MNTRKTAGYLGLAIFGGCNVAFALGKVDDPKQLNNTGKTVLALTQVIGTASSTASELTLYVPNTIGHGNFDATPWKQAEDEIQKPAFRVFKVA